MKPNPWVLLVATLSLCLVAAGAVHSEDPLRAWDPVVATAEIRGSVVLRGEAPPRTPIPVDERCRVDLAGAQPLTESVVTGKDGALRNVFVRVRQGLERWKCPGPDRDAVLDQKGCLFVPHVIGLQVGQPLRVRNSDACAHNVHGAPRRNNEFNFAQPRAGAENFVVFLVPEIGVRLRCDVHRWMGAWICVSDHPFFAVTGEDGTFRLSGLPPGEYAIETWHETYGTRTATVSVGEQETRELRFAYDAGTPAERQD